jgi:membrane protein required for colicin V production
MQWIWLDWVFVAMLATSTILALFRGFVREALSLVTWLAALLLALSFAPRMGYFLFSSFKNLSVQYGAGFLIIFLAVLIVGMIINYFLGKIIRLSGLGFFDTALGAVFGFIRGACLVFIIIVLLGIPSLDMSELLARSAIAHDVSPFIAWISKDLASHPEYTQKFKSEISDINDSIT